MTIYRPTKEEVTLHHLVERATEDLTPNRHYSLEIGDIALRNDALRAFEQLFDQSLERTGKAKTVLGFSETSRQLYPRSIHLPLDRSDVHASLLHTNSSLGYVPTFSAPLANQKQAQLSLPNVSAEELMDLLDIEQPPTDGAIAYRLWLSQLLEQSDSWSLHEQLEMPVSIGDDHISSLVFRHQIRIDRAMVHTVRSIAHKTFIPTPTDERVVMRTTLEIGGDDSYQTELRAYKEYGTQESHDFLGDAPVNWQAQEPLSFTDEDDFSPLLELAHDAIQMRQAQ